MGDKSSIFSQFLWNAEPIWNIFSTEKLEQKRHIWATFISIRLNADMMVFIVPLNFDTEDSLLFL